jgi:uncharacterized YigZ family protein
MKNNIDDIDAYYTVKERCRTSLKIKASEFIATVIPVKNIEEVTNNLSELRSEFFDAAHNCFAYRIGNSGHIFRYSDDGEPSGSAGKPILFAIDKFNFSDILVVVTRYFGGTKLGVGGLVRAYSDSAESALITCTRLPIYITETFELTCEYDEISLIKHLIADYSVTSEEIYTENVKFIIKVLKSRSNTFIDYIFSSTNGRVIPKHYLQGS